MHLVAKPTNQDDFHDLQRERKREAHLLLLSEEELRWCDERHHARRCRLETAHLAGYLWTSPLNIIPRRGRRPLVL
jgi:hypothetical protein